MALTRVLVLYILYVVNEINSLVLPGNMDLDVKGKVFVEIISRDSLFRDRNKRTANHFPARLPVRFPLDGQSMRFELQRNDLLSTNVPVYVLRDGVVKMEKLHNHSDSCLYQDLENGASFHVTVNTLENGDNSYSFLGSFINDTKEYIIRPLATGGQNVSRNPWNTTHQIMGPTRNANFTSDSKYPDEMRDMLWDRKLAYPVPSRQRRATNSYKVEILFVIDYSVYYFWYSKNTGTSDEKDSKAKESIRQFYAFVLNGMAIRYASIRGMSFSITPVSAGIFIANTSSVSYWTESHKTPSNTVDASSALDLFKTWVTSQSGLPEFDHAMTSTAYDLTKDGSNTNAGLAFQSTICSQNRESIIEDHFNFNIMTVAAHELGHSLGALHDGSGNDCSDSDGFVMTTVSTVKEGAFATNPFKFSSCSIFYFSTLLDALNNNAENCLTDVSQDYDPDALAAYDGQYPGQTYNIDEQCQYIEGDLSYLCRGLYENGIADICTTMYCKVPGSSSCKILYPGEGTSCGDKKWCLSGICTSSNDAPSLSETCPFGDQPGIYRNSLTCSEFIRSSRIQCTVATTRLTCCASCQDVITGIPDCDYGDLATGCRADNCRFYSQGNLAKCCETCYDGPPITDPPDTTTEKLGTPATTVAPPTIHLVTTVVPRTTNPVTTMTPTTAITKKTTSAGVTTTATPTFFDNIKDNIIIIAAAGGGGLIIIILVVVCVCFCRSKKTPDKLIESHRRRTNTLPPNGFDNPRYPYPNGHIPMVTGNSMYHHQPLQGRLSRESYTSVDLRHSQSHRQVANLRSSSRPYRY